MAASGNSKFDLCKSFQFCAGIAPIVTHDIRQAAFEE
jgi:hypothetical protein